MIRGKKKAASSQFTQATHAAEYILKLTDLRPRIAIVLGSGLGAFVNELADATRIDFRSIPYFPVPTAVGHAGRLVVGKIAGVPIAVMQGRVHLYEGYSLAQVIFPMRVLGRLGIRAAILTNAAGGISAEYSAGCLVLLSDHINLQGGNPLAGANDERFGARFPDLTTVYSLRYQEIAREEAERLGLKIFEGVYAGLSGPSYETPAEIRFLRTIGADLVGMSTVPEAIAAAQMGIRVLGISCVTNMAAGIIDHPITPEEVLQTGERVQETFTPLLQAIVPRIALEEGSSRRTNRNPGPKQKCTVDHIRH